MTAEKFRGFCTDASHGRLREAMPFITEEASLQCPRAATENRNERLRVAGEWNSSVALAVDHQDRRQSTDPVICLIEDAARVHHNRTNPRII